MLITICIQEYGKVSLNIKSSSPYSPEIVTIQFFGATFLEDNLAPRVNLDLKILVLFQQLQTTLIKKSRLQNST